MFKPTLILTLALSLAGCTGTLPPGATGAGSQAGVASRKAATVSLGAPTNVTVDAGGNLYVPNEGNVLKIGGNGDVQTLIDMKQSPTTPAGEPVNALLWPTAVAVDPAGMIYIVAGNVQKLAKLNANGTLTVIAGNGTAEGDGIPALTAQLGGPSSIAVDKDGVLYVADPYRHTVSKIGKDGMLRTVAGAGTGTANVLKTPSDIAFDGTGTLYVTDTDQNKVFKLSSDGTLTTLAGTGDAGFSGDGGPATAATLNGPAGLAVDTQGNVYIADTGNHRVRKVDPAGQITTIAGTDRSTTTYPDLGDKGPATAARLTAPTGLAIDTQGNLYVTDRDLNVIRMIDRRGTITTVAGTPPASISGGETPYDQWGISQLALTDDQKASALAMVSALSATEAFRISSDTVLTLMSRHAAAETLPGGLDGDSALGLQEKNLTSTNNGDGTVTTTFTSRQADKMQDDTQTASRTTTADGVATRFIHRRTFALRPPMGPSQAQDTYTRTTTWSDEGQQTDTYDFTSQNALGDRTQSLTWQIGNGMVTGTLNWYKGTATSTADITGTAGNASPMLTVSNAASGLTLKGIYADNKLTGLEIRVHDTPVGKATFQ